MSEHQRSAWGAREDSSSVSAAAAAASSVWWPTAADQQSHHQQLLSHHQQQQLAAAVQQHEAAVRSTAAAAAAQQLFSYKMSNNNFQQQQQQQQQQNQITTTSSVSTSPSPTNNQQSQTNANNAAAAAAVAAGMRYGDYTAATGRPGDAALAANQAAQAAAAAAQWWSYPNSGVGINSTNIQNHLHNANAVNSLLNRGGVATQQRGIIMNPKPRGRMTAYAYFVQTRRGELKQSHPDETVVFKDFSRDCAERWKNRGGVGVQRGGIIMNPKPRGRVTAYAYFVQAYREERKKMHPDETVVFKDFSRECAERWKTMSDKEKKRFHEMADKDKKRYDTEMQSYVPPKGEKVRGKKRKQMKDPNAPKRPLSAFFWFCNDERGQVKVLNPDYGVGDIAKELGRKWADAEPHVKQKYESMAEKDKARYEREMIEYKKKKPGDMMVPNEQLLIKQHESEGEDPEEDEEEE